MPKMFSPELGDHVPAPLRSEVDALRERLGLA